MHRSVRLLIATLFGVAANAAIAVDESAATWQAAQRAQAAQQALSDRYLAIWATLDAHQKARFAAQERSWLNEGRQQEQRACVTGAGTRTDLVDRTCEAEVAERHLRALPAPQRVAASR